MARPLSTDYPEFFARYISLVPEEDITMALANQLPVIITLLDSISEKDSMYAYSPGKWTMKEMLQHIIDAERIFAYRALCIARKEKASLPSFDENEYAGNSCANDRSWKSLCNEFLNCRKSLQDLFESFNAGMLEERGASNNRGITVLSLGFISVGHLYSHINVIKDKYLTRS